MSRSLWSTGVATLGDYIKQLREIDNKRYESNVTSKSSEPDCYACHDTGYDASGYACSCTESHGPRWIKCPDSGRLCSTACCPNQCNGDKDRDEDRCPDHDKCSTDIESTSAEDSTSSGCSEGEAVNRWPWPCVIPGAFCKTWD